MIYIILNVIQCLIVTSNISVNYVRNLKLNNNNNDNNNNNNNNININININCSRRDGLWAIHVFPVVINEY